MIPEFTGQLPEHFSPASRVWIYQADRPFTGTEKLIVGKMLSEFTASWRSHGAVVSGFGRIFFDRFVVLMTDETAATVSGCSTDSSVQLIREIENRTGAAMFNRQLLAFVIGDEIELISLSQLPLAVRAGRLSPDNLFFNNAVTTLAEMRVQWIVPAGKSWLQNRPAFAAAVR